MKPTHYRAAHWINEGLFDDLTSFRALEDRINAIIEEKDRGDIFEIFIEGYLATQPITQHARHWVVGDIPIALREQYNLPSDGTGIDGIYETFDGSHVAYQVKYRFLFDEPLSNLDAKLRVRMRIEIKKLQRELGVTSIYVTHDQIEAMTLADRLAVINEGRIEQMGSSMDLYADPKTLFVATFIGSPQINLIPVEVQQGQIKYGDTVLSKREGLAAAGPVVLGIRPEHLFVDPDGPLSVKVELTEKLGADTLVYGALSGMGAGLAEFCFRAEENAQFSAGDDVTLGYRAGQEMLFQQDTGERLA